MVASVSRPRTGGAWNGPRIAALVGGWLLLIAGAACAALYLAWPLLDSVPGSPLAGAPPWARRPSSRSSAPTGSAWAAALIWQALRAARGEAGRRFRPALRLGILAVVLFPVALAWGVDALTLPHRAAGYIFPAPALLVILAPAALTLALVGWGARGARNEPAARAASYTGERAPGGLAGRTSREDPFATALVRRVVGDPTGRRVLGALAWGLGGATLLAMILEIVLALIAVLVGLVVLGAGGALGGQRDFVQLLAGSSSAGCDETQALLSNPLVLAGLVLALGVAAPLVEEPAKSIGVIWLRRRLVSPRDAILYGAAAGVGFGMIENAFYNVQDVSQWWATATVRFGAIVMHACAAGLFGAAWFYALERRDRGRFWRYALASLGVHGLWNASTVGIMALSAAQMCKNDPVALITSGNFAGYAVALWFVGLTVGAAALVTLLARRLGPREPAALAARPLSVRSPERG